MKKILIRKEIYTSINNLYYRNEQNISTREETDPQENELESKNMIKAFNEVKVTYLNLSDPHQKDLRMGTKTPSSSYSYKDFYKFTPKTNNGENYY